MYRQTGRSGSQGPLIKGLVPTQRTLCFILRMLEGSVRGSMKVSWGREGPKEAGTILRSAGSSVVSPPVTHLPWQALPLVSRSIRSSWKVLELRDPWQALLGGHVGEQYQERNNDGQRSWQTTVSGLETWSKGNLVVIFGVSTAPS